MASSEVFQVDPVDSESPGVFASVPKGGSIMVAAVIPVAGGFQSGTSANIMSMGDFEGNVYVATAPLSAAASQGSNTLSLACSAPAVIGALHDYSVTCANASPVALSMIVSPTLASVTGTSVVGTSAAPVVIAAGATGTFHVFNDAASTESLAVRIVLAPLHAPIYI